MPNKLVQHAHQHPPKCVFTLRPVPTEAPHPTIRLPPAQSLHHAGNEASWNDCAFFTIGCPCGNRWVYLMGYYLKMNDGNRDSYFCSPLGVECPRCGSVSEMLDSRQHGFEGEQGADCNATGEGERERYRYANCGVSPLQLIAGFGYAGCDNLDGEMLRRPQDYFDTFMLYGRCQGCDTVLEITWFECQ